MAIFRPQQAKLEIRTALKRGYWFEKYDMSNESRHVAERMHTYLSIRWPTPRGDRRIREDRDF